MSYSNSYQSNIGVPQSYDTNLINLNALNITASNSIVPSTDNTVDLGRPTKRFRSAYVEEMDIDNAGNINEVPVESISGSLRNKFQAQANQLRPILVQRAPGIPSDTSSFIASVALDTTRRVLVAVGSTVGGTNFICYSSSINVDDTIWSLPIANTLVPTAGRYNPRAMVYDSINDVFVAFNHTVTAANQTEYYTCPASDLTQWTMRTTFSYSRALGLAFHNVDNASYIFVSTDVGTTAFNLGYSTDAGVTFTQFTVANTKFVNQSGATVTDIALNSVMVDFIQRPDAVLGDPDRFLFITQSFDGVSTWRSDRVSGPYYAKGNYGSSINIRASLYNPYYKTICMIKRTTPNLLFYNYTAGTAFDIGVSYSNVNYGLTGGNPNLVLSLQNNSYLPQLKYHVYSFAVQVPNSTCSSVYWDGQSDSKVIDAFAGTSPSTLVSLNSAWTFDLINNVGYTANRSNNQNGFTASSNMCVLTMTFMNPTNKVSPGPNSLNNLTSTTRMVIDKFDRLAVKSTDLITGGIGTPLYPIKSVLFNNIVKSVGRDACIQQWSSLSNNMLSSVNADIVAINPSALGKSTVSFNALKTRAWTSTTTGQIFNGTVACRNTRLIKELNRMYAIGASSSGVAIDIIYSIDGGLTWINNGYLPGSLFPGVSPVYQSDIAYSPVFNTLVVTSGFAGTSLTAGGSTSFYSTDDGMNWFSCKFEFLPTVQMSYCRVIWISEYGNCGMFVMFATAYSQSGAPIQLVVVSEDGIQWRQANSMPTGLPFTAANRIFVQCAYDPSRKVLAATFVPPSGNNGTMIYTRDGDNWLTEDTSQTINIYAKDIVIRAGVNDKIDFSINAGATLTSTLTPATYSPGALAIHIGRTMTTTAATEVLYASYSIVTGKFTIQINNNDNFSTPDTFQILWSSGPSNATTPREDLGWTPLSDTAIASSLSSTSTVFYSTNSALTNNVIDLKRTAGPVLYTVYLIPGVYSVFNANLFHNHVRDRMNLIWATGGGNAPFTVTFNTGTGIFTYASTNAFEILWLTGANNAQCPFLECGFSKVDTVSATSTNSTITNAYISAGTHRGIAYSPSLDIWVHCGSIVGTGVSPGSTNLHWTKNLIGAVGSSSNVGWNPVNVFLNDGVTRPNFADVIWCESLQLFLLLNANTAAASPNDRNIWISKDGKSFSPITVATSPKTTVTTVDGNFAARLNWDTISNSLFIDPGSTLAGTLTYHPFSSLNRNELLPMPGCQYGIFASSTATPAGAAITTYSVTFDTPFTVAPNHIFVTVQNAASSINAQIGYHVLAITATGFDLRVCGASGSLGGGAAPSFQWIAWERM